jgi:hypothetical protein
VNREPSFTNLPDTQSGWIYTTYSDFWFVVEAFLILGFYINAEKIVFPLKNIATVY